jgi:hypothetical protein
MRRRIMKVLKVAACFVLKGPGSMERKSHWDEKERKEIRRSTPGTAS